LIFYYYVNEMFFIHKKKPHRSRTPFIQSLTTYLTNNKYRAVYSANLLANLRFPSELVYTLSRWVYSKHYPLLTLSLVSSEQSDLLQIEQSVYTSVGATDQSKRVSNTKAETKSPEAKQTSTSETSEGIVVIGWFLALQSNILFDPSKYTHIVYGYATVLASAGIPDFTSDPTMLDFASRMRLRNPDAKVLLAIRATVVGDGAKESPLQSIAADVQARIIFAEAVVKFCMSSKFDGIVLDFGEWRNGFLPAEVSSITRQSPLFATLPLLLEEIVRTSQALGFGASTVNGKSVVEKPFIVTLAVPAYTSSVVFTFDADTVIDHVDFICLLTFNMASSGAKEIEADDHISALPNKFSLQKDYTPTTTFAHSSLSRIQSIVNAWVVAGVPPHQLVVSIATFGRSFILQSADETYVGSPVKSFAAATTQSQLAGVMTQSDIAAFTSKAETQILEDTETSTIYATDGVTWVSYDSAGTIDTKLSWVLQQGLRGAMLWWSGWDDFEVQSQPIITAAMMSAVSTYGTLWQVGGFKCCLGLPHGS
jgi:GH18 family chitinase